MTYQIGQTVGFDYGRSIQGCALPAPVWFALKVPPQKERAAREHLKAKGIHACYPERERTWRVQGRTYRRMLPVITQIVYAKFGRQPNWDVLRARGLITGVFSRQGVPIALHGDIISCVMGLPTTAERLAAAQRELLRVRDGDKARILEGPLSGMLVDVETVKDGRVWFNTLAGIKGSASAQGLERVLPSGIR